MQKVEDPDLYVPLGGFESAFYKEVTMPADHDEKSRRKAANAALRNGKKNPGEGRKQRRDVQIGGDGVREEQPTAGPPASQDEEEDQPEELPGAQEDPAKAPEKQPQAAAEKHPQPAPEEEEFPARADADNSIWNNTTIQIFADETPDMEATVTRNQSVEVVAIGDTQPGVGVGDEENAAAAAGPAEESRGVIFFHFNCNYLYSVACMQSILIFSGERKEIRPTWRGWATSLHLLVTGPERILRA